MKNKKAFTVSELLVVVGGVCIIGIILVALGAALNRAAANDPIPIVAQIATEDMHNQDNMRTRLAALEEENLLLQKQLASSRNATNSPTTSTNDDQLPQK